MGNASEKIKSTMADETTLGVLCLLVPEREKAVRLQQSLVRGLGERVQQSADRVQRIVKVDRDRAIDIAESVIGYVISRLRSDSEKAAGFTHKVWIVGPNCPIPGHKQAAEKYTQPIPISEPFLVNGVALMYAGDFLSGGVEQCLGCQCMTGGRFLSK